MLRKTIGPFEFEILCSLIAQPDDAYGLSIRKRLQEDLKRTVSLGAVYSSLERLEDKGFISSWWGEATAERGGRRKRLYRIEAAGGIAVRTFGKRFEDDWRPIGATI
jgi:PadR family transcriptional regulator, regulatory protein PadR